MGTRQRIVHLTSVHPRYDTRVYWKECKTLAGAGYGVTLIVADGRGEESGEGIQILDVGAPKNRFSRILLRQR